MTTKTKAKSAAKKVAPQVLVDQLIEDIRVREIARAKAGGYQISDSGTAFYALGYLSAMLAKIAGRSPLAYKEVLETLKWVNTNA